MYIIHSANKDEFEKEISVGMYGEKSINKFGFIHCSDLDTYYLVAPNFKDDFSERIILLIDTDKVKAEIKWEDGGGLDFPHIYGLLDSEAIVGIYNHIWNKERNWVPNDELFQYASNGLYRKI